jgi:small-conductance mechanosensitive channel
MVKVYKCEYCNKEIKRAWVFPHVIMEKVGMFKKRIGEKMKGNMIIKDGMLVKKEDLKKQEAKPVQEENKEEVIEETKSKLFKKSEAAPKPEVKEPTNKEEDEMYQEFLRMRRAQMEQQKIQEEEAQRQHALAQQRMEQMRQQEMQAMTQPRTQMRQPPVQKQIKEVVFTISLINGLNVIINSDTAEAQSVYDYIEEEMATKKVLSIENKMIPVSSIALVSFD